ncbi:MAG: recombination mediator RecR [Simkania sp.]|nr:recombination mediator RecR [Simkania sp.]
MSKFPAHLTSLLGFLRKWPGVGYKTAERYAFHLLNWSEHELDQLSNLIRDIKKKILSCPDCHAFMEESGCHFCNLSLRDPSMLCVIASPKDLFALEETRAFKGIYYVLGSLLSPLQNRNPSLLGIDHLKERISRLHVQEVIIALDSTLEGDATALYIKKELDSLPLLKVSRLAFGLPMNSSFDFIDGGTLSKALTGRQRL